MLKSKPVNALSGSLTSASSMTSVGGLQQAFPLQQEGFEGALLRSGALDIADWLKVSWFYPEGFRPEVIEEAPDAWTVFGNEVAYKFLKSLDPRGQRAQQRWRLSCQEIKDNLPLGSQVYLGLRCLIQDEEELLWESRARSGDLDPGSLPSNVQDVALVLRRLSAEEKFTGTLIQRPGLENSLLKRLALVFSNFHLTQKAEHQRQPQFSADYLLRLHEDRSIEPLRNALIDWQGSFNRETLRIFEEVLHFYQRCLNKLDSRVRQRVAQHLVIDSHRGALLKNVYVLQDEVESSAQLTVIGRARQEREQRWDDCLCDVASLSLDLEVTRGISSSETFEDAYFAAHPQAYDADLLAFYKVMSATKRLCDFEQNLSGTPLHDLMEEAELLSHLTIRLTQNLSRPHILFFVPEPPKDSELSESLAQDVASLLGSELIQEIDVLPDYLPSPLSPEQVAERLLHHCQLLVEQHRSLVVISPNILSLPSEALQQFCVNTPAFLAFFSQTPSPIFPGVRAHNPTQSEFLLTSSELESFDRVFLTLHQVRLHIDSHEYKPYFSSDWKNPDPIS